jgi:hypothetical protein
MEINQVKLSHTCVVYVCTRFAGWHVYLQTKNPNLVYFPRVLELKMLVYIMAILQQFGIHILVPFGIFVITYLVHFCPFGILYPE